MASEILEGQVLIFTSSAEAELNSKLPLTRKSFIIACTCFTTTISKEGACLMATAIHNSLFLQSGMSERHDGENRKQLATLRGDSASNGRSRGDSLLFKT